MVKAKRRVALVALHFLDYSTNLALALSEECEVLLILYRESACTELGHEWQTIFDKSRTNIVVLDKPKSALSVLRNTWRLVRVIKEYAPEVVHYQEALRDELVLALFFLRSMPTVLTVHDPRTHSGADSRRFRYSRMRLYRPLVRRAADVAITHGHLLADDLIKECPYFKGKVRSVPHGPLGLRGMTETASTRGLRLLFFGRIHEYKGLGYFVDSVTTLRNKGYAVTGIVAGRGNDLDRHRRKMESAGCFEILDRYIPPEEISELFLESFAIILPYLDGTQSGVAAMALGFGRPVVATAVGSIPELVRNEENGLLVPPSDAIALVGAIERLLTDKDLWERLAAGALRLRDGQLSWRSIADKTTYVYKFAEEMRSAPYKQLLTK